ncbi:isochorismate synthase [Citrobacter koseri]|uniref:Isochorismate synthase n=1 Tax=Citrobacter koseri TaxID=545 RepID=A0A447UTA2_CITKO|nr:isochorismate synthase [Citrobacter koseri]
MDTSLAEEVQQKMATLTPDRFFFMSPYRSFTTSGCFARFAEPAVDGDSLDSPSNKNYSKPLPTPEHRVSQILLWSALSPSIPASHPRCSFLSPGRPSPDRQSNNPRVTLPVIRH